MRKARDGKSTLHATRRRGKRVNLSPEDRDAVERLVFLGFPSWEAYQLQVQHAFTDYRISEFEAFRNEKGTQLAMYWVRRGSLPVEKPREKKPWRPPFEPGMAKWPKDWRHYRVYRERAAELGCPPGEYESAEIWGTQEGR